LFVCFCFKKSGLWASSRRSQQPSNTPKHTHTHTSTHLDTHTYTSQHTHTTPQPPNNTTTTPTTTQQPPTKHQTPLPTQAKIQDLHKQIEELTGKVGNLQTENAALHSRTSILEKV
jgi:molecular chaperone GrpE (heat shock protein)